MAYTGHNYQIQARAAIDMWKLLESKSDLIDSITKGASMNPDITVLAIQNPGEEAEIFRIPSVDAYGAIDNYGEKMQHGAFVSLTARDSQGNTTDVKLYVVDRIGSTVYLQMNDRLQDEEAPSIDYIGGVVASGEAPLPTPPVPEPEPVELETFTVFGNNDDNENFVAVVSATEDTVHEVGVQAGLVDEGYEDQVDIVLIVKGDHSDAEPVES